MRGRKLSTWERRRLTFSRGGTSWKSSFWVALKRPERISKGARVWRLLARIARPIQFTTRVEGLEALWARTTSQKRSQTNSSLKVTSAKSSSSSCPTKTCFFSFTRSYFRALIQTSSLIKSYNKQTTSSSPLQLRTSMKIWSSDPKQTMPSNWPQRPAKWLSKARRVVKSSLSLGNQSSSGRCRALDSVKCTPPMRLDHNRTLVGPICILAQPPLSHTIRLRIRW